MVKKSVRSWKYILLGLLVVVFIFLIVFTYTRDCGDDKVCFNKARDECMSAKVTNIQDNNTFLYEIDGSREDQCVITVHLVNVGMELSSQVKANLENKGMLCEVSNNVDIYNIKELSAYCTGPLKEVLLQMTVERLYGFVVKTFGKNVVDKDLESQLPYTVGRN
jgi:hypothetical protein